MMIIQKKLFFLLMRIAISVGLLAGLLWKVDFTPLQQVLPAFRPAFYVAALGLVIATLWIQGVILKQLLQSQNLQARTGTIFKLMILSNFFGVFLPGGVGPDVVLCFNLCRSSSSKETVLGGVIFSRLATLFGMVLLACLASFSAGCPIPGVRWFAGLIVLAGLVLFAATRIPGGGEWLAQHFSWLRRYRLSAFLFNLLAALTRFGKAPSFFLITVPLFLTVGLSRALIDYLIALSIGVHVPFVCFLVFTTIVTLATVLPLTLAGLGIREGTYIGVLATVGVPAAQAFSISIISFSLILWICLAGAILYIRQYKPRDESPRPTLL